jgi:hypothetical protein
MMKMTVPLLLQTVLPHCEWSLPLLLCSLQLPRRASSLCSPRQHPRAAAGTTVPWIGVHLRPRQLGSAARRKIASTRYICCWCTFFLCSQIDWHATFCLCTLCVCLLACAYTWRRCTSMCIMHSDGKPALACECAHTFFVVGVQLQREHDGDDDDDDGDGRDVDGRIHKKGKPSPVVWP